MERRKVKRIRAEDPHIHMATANSRFARYVLTSGPVIVNYVPCVMMYHQITSSMSSISLILKGRSNPSAIFLISFEGQEYPHYLCRRQAYTILRYVFAPGIFIKAGVFIESIRVRRLSVTEQNPLQHLFMAL